MNSANDILNHYNNTKVPVIINTCLKLSKTKFIVPFDMTLSQFHYLLSKQIKKNEKDSLIFFINNKLPMQSQTMGSLYKLYKCPIDKYLYINVSKEKTFG